MRHNATLLAAAVFCFRFHFLSFVLSLFVALSLVPRVLYAYRFWQLCCRDWVPISAGWLYTEYAIG